MFAIALLEQSGMPRDRARTVADVIVEADLLGHDTHGLDQLAGYLVQIQEGHLRTSGDPEVVADLGACLTWDGRRLPGHWLVKQAIAEARHRILSHPIVTVVIGRGHHIGCLQAYLKPVTDAGFIIVLMCSDPSAAGVTPHGGVASRITPNPIGHKGFSLALIVEALTSGLAGHGRSEKPESWTSSVFVQLIDPDVFGGRDAFVREMEYLVELCHATPVAPGNPPVRLPGEGALGRRRRQIREGVQLHENILPALKPWAERFGVPLPKSLAELGSHN
jgi:LDH2 family malate/lactate/ureidoglycolate dehydrogenase